MNAAETIQAAIDKLTRLRAEASPGPWAAWKKPVSTLYRTDLVKYGLEDASGADLFEAQSPQNAQLLETLHATIDAQLALFRFAERQAALGEVPLSPIVTLAHAIVGKQPTDD